MYPSLNFLLYGLACAGLLFASGGVASAQTSDLGWETTATQIDYQTVRVLSGGGRIWEGEHVNQPSCDITFSGQIRKIGPGNTTMDYDCNWTIHFQDVQGSEVDRSVFRADRCRDLTVWRVGEDPDATMRVVLLGSLNGMPGYSVIMIAVDWTEPGGQDQIRFRLFRGEVVIGEPNPAEELYDTSWEFAVYPDLGYRTYLDSGNLQSKLESTSP